MNFLKGPELFVLVWFQLVRGRPNTTFWPLASPDPTISAEVINLQYKARATKKEINEDYIF